MQQSANECEHILESMLRLYALKYDPQHIQQKPSWLSIYMARIIGSNIPIALFKEKNGAQHGQTYQQLMSESTIVALRSLEKANIPYDRRVAAEITGPLIKKVMFAMSDEIKTGPSDTENGKITEGLGHLVELFQGAMTATIGKDKYSVDVKFRFRMPIRGGIYDTLKTATKVILNK